MTRHSEAVGCRGQQTYTQCLVTSSNGPCGWEGRLLPEAAAGVIVVALMLLLLLVLLP